VFPASARLRKLKESFAISGAHFFAYFLWARPKKVSQPRQGMKQGMHHKNKNHESPQHQPRNQPPSASP
ncbi:hypothetical protein, partial [Ralstonia sp.]|uniref:hypothetical protein n=1 Tax=Ralstonia sp. TaxID=54061 RepID=UPI002CB50A53